MIRSLLSWCRERTRSEAARNRRERARLAAEAYQRSEDRRRARCVGNLPQLRLSIAKERGERA